MTGGRQRHGKGFPLRCVREGIHARAISRPAFLFFDISIKKPPKSRTAPTRARRKSCERFAEACVTLCHLRFSTTCARAGVPDPSRAEQNIPRWRFGLVWRGTEIYGRQGRAAATSDVVRSAAGSPSRCAAGLSRDEQGAEAEERHRRGLGDFEIPDVGAEFDDAAVGHVGELLIRQRAGERQ